MGFLLNAIPNWLSDQVAKLLNGLWGLLSATMLTVPDVTRLPQVQRLVSTSMVVVNTAFVLAIMAAGALVMMRETVQIRYGIGDLAPRLVVAFVASNFAARITSALISGANALTVSLTGDDIASRGSFQQIGKTVAGGMLGSANTLLLAIVGLLIAVLVGMLVVLWITRLGILVCLAGIAPLALACHCLPFLEPVARLWWRAMVGTLGTVVLQAFTLHAALVVFLDPSANLRTIGLPDDPSGVLNLFIVACLFWVVVRIPGLMRRYVTRGGPGVGGYVFRVLIAQQLTRGLSRALGQTLRRTPTRQPAAPAVGRRPTTAGFGGTRPGTPATWVAANRVAGRRPAVQRRQLPAGYGYRPGTRALPTGSPGGPGSNLPARRGDVS
jgi:hypothetical protein